MARFTHITFTGVDEYTDIERLYLLKDKYPFVEFGVLFSKNWEKHGNRYMNPKCFSKLRLKSYDYLPLSLHLCGSIAREMAKGNYLAIDEFGGGLEHTHYFSRTQLNINLFDQITENCNYFGKYSENEVIIQQKNSDNCQLFNLVKDKIKKCAMLLDASGGTGKEIEIKTEPWMKKYHIGFAGGIGEHNIKDILLRLCFDDNLSEFWVDMETSVRTDDKFDLDKVERICKIVDNLIFYKQK